MSVERRQTTGLVCILDALGIRGLTIASSLDFLDKRDELMAKLGSMPDINLWPELPHVRSFGDTIVATWSVAKIDILVISLFSSWLSHSIWHGLTNGILWRGAMSFGEFIESSDAIIGPAIGDAAAWYDQAQSAGIIATPKLGMQISLIEHDSAVRSKGELSPHLVHAPITLKGGRKPTMWSVPWPDEYYRLCSSLHEARTELLRHLSACRVPMGTEDKYLNTLAFFDWYQDNVGCRYTKKAEPAMSDDSRDGIER